MLNDVSAKYNSPNAQRGLLARFEARNEVGDIKLHTDPTSDSLVSRLEDQVVQLPSLRSKEFNDCMALTQRGTVDSQGKLTEPTSDAQHDAVFEAVAQRVHEASGVDADHYDLTFGKVMSAEHGIIMADMQAPSRDCQVDGFLICGHAHGYSNDGKELLNYNVTIHTAPSEEGGMLLVGPKTTRTAAQQEADLNYFRNRE